MSLAINRTAPGLGTADAPAVPALPGVMRQMQAAPEAIREDTENDVLIIPMVALREGVFQCATCPAPELYLADNFGRIPDAWNDRMVTIGHPQIGGRFVSAGTSGIWERDGVGRIKNAHVQDKKLKVEAHIDMAKVADLGSDAIDLVERIRRGEAIDVSVGAFVQSVQQFGVLEGKKFEAVQTNYVPDHVAILPAGVKGACSWTDGCGAPRVNATCACGGSGTCQCGEIPTMNQLTAQQLAAAMQLHLQTITGGMSTSPSLADAQLGDRTKREMLHTALATKESGFFIIIQVFDDHLVYRNDREQTLRRDFSIDEASGTVTLSDEATEGTLVSEFMPITVQEEPDMDRQQAVNQLIAAQGNTWAETDRAFLMGVDDGQFSKLTASHQPSANAASAADEPTAQPSAGGEQAASTATTATEDAPAVNSVETPPAAAAARDSQTITVQSYIDAAPPGIREWLGDGDAMHEKERGRLVKILTANQRCPFTEAQLVDKRTGELLQLVQLAGTAPIANNYVGQAPVSANGVGLPAAYKALPTTPEWPSAPN